MCKEKTSGLKISVTNAVLVEKGEQTLGKTEVT